MATTPHPDDGAESAPTTAEIATYRKTCTEEAEGGASIIAKPSQDIAQAQGMNQIS